MAKVKVKSEIKLVDHSLYRLFTREFCAFFQGENLLKLRFFLVDHLDLLMLDLNENVVGITLLNALGGTASKISVGESVISPTRVNLLWEIAKVTKMVKAENCVFNYVRKNKIHNLDGEDIKEYRKILYDALMNVTANDLAQIIAFYNIGYHGFKNVWNTVHYLEKAQELKTRKQLETFASLLNGKARGICEDGLKLLKPKNEDKLENLYFVTKGGPVTRNPHNERSSSSTSTRPISNTRQDETGAAGSVRNMVPENTDEITKEMCDDIDKAFEDLKNTLTADTQPLRINRSQIVDRLLSMYKDDDQLVFKLIKVEFEGEPGEDYGGLSTEMFSLFWMKVQDLLFSGEHIKVPEMSPYRLDDEAWKFRSMGAIFSHSLVLTKTVPLQMPTSILIQLSNIERTNIEESVMLNDFFQYVTLNEKRILQKAISSFGDLTSDEKTTLTNIFSVYSFNDMPRSDRIRKQVLSIAKEVLIRKPRDLIEEMRKGIPQCHLDYFWSKLSIGHIRGIISRQKPTQKNVADAIKPTDEYLTNEKEKVLHFLREYVINLNNKSLSAFLFMVTGSFHKPCKISVSFVTPVGERCPAFRTCGNIIELPTSYKHFQDFDREMTEQLNNIDSFKYSFL